MALWPGAHAIMQEKHHAGDDAAMITTASQDRKKPLIQTQGDSYIWQEGHKSVGLEICRCSGSPSGSPEGRAKLLRPIDSKIQSSISFHAFKYFHGLLRAQRTPKGDAWWCGRRCSEDMSSEVLEGCRREVWRGKPPPRSLERWTRHTP